MVMSFHHRVTQSITEFYSFDFKLIKLCVTSTRQAMLSGTISRGNGFFPNSATKRLRETTKSVS